MKLNVLIGGKAGQGINKISEVVSDILAGQGYFVFNYRDYPSLIRGGHNFNVLVISDRRVGSYESELDGIVALDDQTLEIHKKELKKEGFVLTMEDSELGINLNVALAGALVKTLGISKEILVKEIKKGIGEKSVSAAEKGYGSFESKFDLKKLNNKVSLMSGSQAIMQGAVNSGVDLYIAYPMTPATGAMHETAAKQVENNMMVFQAESELSVVNSALGASFAGAKVMIGTSGGGFDLMGEALSLQGQSEVPLVVYLASRPGPGTGVPTYTSQADLDIALRSGHGEFPRVVVAPGDPVETIEKVNEACYLAEKFGTLGIVLGDKHLAESGFSTDRKQGKVMDVKVNRRVPGKEIVKVTSYEHDEEGNTTEDASLTEKNADLRIEKYGKMKKEAEKFEMIKVYGKKDSKNLVIGWGSTKGAILDAIDGLDVKFLQVLYLKPLSNEIRKEMQKAKKVVLVEGNVTGQLGRLIREKTGIKIEDRILKYDSRPFVSDELRKEIERRLK